MHQVGVNELIDMCDGRGEGVPEAHGGLEATAMVPVQLSTECEPGYLAPPPPADSRRGQAGRDAGFDRRVPPPFAPRANARGLY